MKPVYPDEALHSLRKHLSIIPWFHGAVILGGVGRDAIIEVRTTSLPDAQDFIDSIGGRWSGYPVLARRVAT